MKKKIGEIIVSKIVLEHNIRGLTTKSKIRILIYHISLLEITLLMYLLEKCKLFHSISITVEYSKIFNI